MTRKLQDRLALASYKTRHGLDTLSFSLVEAHVDSHLKRRRPGSSIVSSDGPSRSSSSSSSSTTSEHRVLPGRLESSPLSAPVFSDGPYGSGDTFGSRKKLRFHDALPGPGSRSAGHNPRRNASVAGPPCEGSGQAWRSAQHLADASPLQARLHPDFRTAHGPDLSFVSDAPTIPDSPPFGSASGDEDNDLPAHSFNVTAPKAQESLPQTPPPTRPRGLRRRHDGDEGADLLLHLAASPSPAVAQTQAKVIPPSTPPSNRASLPPAPAGTPGNLFGNFSTPGQNFNFADFCNVTPSPAQAAFGDRTPVLPKTPVAAREARRRLNFDSLLPPGASPNLAAAGRGATGVGGLGMELGGELVS
jgi:hypothetical protein